MHFQIQSTTIKKNKKHEKVGKYNSENNFSTGREKKKISFQNN